LSGLYLDSSCIIYLIEATSPFHERVADRILKHQTDSNASLLTSRLARLECRVRPLKDARQDLLRLYDDFFAADRLALIDVSADVIERATELRARHGFKTPDALHLASAIESQASVFLTGDVKLARCDVVAVELLAE
jgi:predicted nucleic acid-binding protein